MPVPTLQRWCQQLRGFFEAVGTAAPHAQGTGAAPQGKAAVRPLSSPSGLISVKGANGEHKTYLKATFTTWLIPLRGVISRCHISSPNACFNAFPARSAELRGTGSSHVHCLRQDPQDVPRRRGWKRCAATEPESPGTCRAPLAPQIFPNPIPLCPRSLLPVAKAPHPRALGWEAGAKLFLQF